MASKLLKPPPIPISHVYPPLPNTADTMRAHTPLFSPTSCRSKKKSSRFGQRVAASSIKSAQQSVGMTGSDFATVSQIKDDLFDALRGINRGIFGVPSEKKNRIEQQVMLLESQNPTPEPTLCLDKVAGSWKLVYSSITILGSRRTKLGLRDLISLGDFFQNIDVAEVCLNNPSHSILLPPTLGLFTSHGISLNKFKAEEGSICNPVFVTLISAQNQS